MANTGPPPGGRPPLMMAPPFAMPPYSQGGPPGGNMPPHHMPMQMAPMGVPPPGQPMGMPPQQPPQQPPPPGMMVQQPGMFPPGPGGMSGMPVRPQQPMALPQGGVPPGSMTHTPMPMPAFIPGQPGMPGVVSSAPVISATPVMTTAAPQLMQQPQQPIAMPPPAMMAVPQPAIPPTVQPPLSSAVASSTATDSPVVASESAVTDAKKKKKSKVKKKKEKEKAPSKASQWTEHKAPDGRTYFYNSETKQSSWSKPDDLKSKAELLLSQSPWKEHKTSDGRTYFYNPENKESVWTIPSEFAELKAKAAALEDGGNEEEDSADSESSSEEESEEEEEETQTGPPENGPAAVVSSEVAGVSKVRINEVEPQAAPAVVKEVVYASREEAREAFKQLLREKGISSQMTWEQALKIIINDSRFTALKKLAEKKQVFNNFKAQRAKEEKEENRQKAKKAREDLLEYMQNNPKVFSTMRFRLAADLFEGDSIWEAVTNETDRKNIFEDALFYVAKREKEEEAKRREFHREMLTDLYRNMPSIKYDTPWAKAQILLEENPEFADNEEFDDMDKEDALVIFENHVRELIKDHEEDKVKAQARERRDQRKNRDNMLQLLDELHEVTKLHSMSQWCDLFPMISEDPRYENMLGQPGGGVVVDFVCSGSTPLDLFKFYVDDLKQRLPDEKKIIKDILKDTNFSVDVNSAFDDFKAVIYADQRSENLDKGNIRLTFNALIEKAEARERELAKMEERKVRKRETAFKAMLKMAAPSLDVNSTWEKCRAQFEAEDAFSEVGEEAERARLFREFVTSLIPSEESENEKKHSKRKSSHHRSSKKHSRKHRRSRSASESSLSEGEYRESHGKDRQEKRRRRSRSPSASDSETERESRKKRHKKEKKSKKRRHHASSGSDSDHYRQHKSSRKDGDRKSENGSGVGEKKKAKVSSHHRASSESEGELQSRRQRLLQELSGD